MPVTLHYPYTTLDEVQAECKNSDIGIAADRMKTAINLASRYIDAHCRMDLRPRDHESEPLVVLPGWVTGETIYLPYPVRSISEIAIGGMAYTGAYEVWRSQWFFEVQRIGDWPQPRPGRRIEIKGLFGLEWESEDEPSDGIPGDIRRAATQIAAAWSGYMMREQVSFDGSRVQLLDSRIPSEAKALLERFKFLFL